MRELLPRNISYDFLGKRNIFFLLSALLVAGSIFVWFKTGSEKYGTDFIGGYELVVQFAEPIESQKIREALQTGGIENPLVQSFEAGSKQYAIRFGLTKSGEVSAAPTGESKTKDVDASKVVKEQVTNALSASSSKNFEIVRTDFVGPTVGSELRRKAMYAVVLGLLGMLTYVAIRFEFAFGLGAVVAVFHDIIIAGGVYLLAGYTINMSTLAAALTIVGYSMNDTIVIFDRVREEILTNNGESLSKIVNRSINSTLSRTLITSLLTLFSVAALLVFGGGAIRDMSLFLFAGMVAGAYSTIYIASPVMIAWHKFRGGTEDV